MMVTSPENAFKEGEQFVVSKEFLDRKISDLTVQEFLGVMRLVKQKQAPIIRRNGPTIEEEIIVLVKAHPEGLSIYDVAKERKEDYSLVRYYINRLIVKGKLQKEKVLNDDKRELAIIKFRED